MLDLDVGFIDDPMKIVTRLDSSKSDIFVQVLLLKTSYFIFIFLFDLCIMFLDNNKYIKIILFYFILLSVLDGYYIYHESHSCWMAHVVHRASP